MCRPDDFPPYPPRATEEDRSVTAYLYRHFGSGGRLLYVGVTEVSQRDRLLQHSRWASWFPLIESVTWEEYPDRDAALAAERRAIETEDPVHNRVHSTRAERRKGRADLGDRRWQVERLLNPPPPPPPTLEEEFASKVIRLRDGRTVPFVELDPDERHLLLLMVAADRAKRERDAKLAAEAERGQPEPPERGP